LASSRILVLAIILPPDALALRIVDIFPVKSVPSMGGVAGGL
jgi:hypothetical protein